MRKKTKKESQKKNEKPFFKTQKKQNMENKCKEMSNKKRKQTKPSILGTEENRKKGLLQKFRRIQKIVKKVLDTENQETTKDKEKRQNFKKRKMVKEPRKHGETTNRTCGQRMKKGGNEEVKETFQ